VAVVVCCPCGNPLDCEHIELVVTLSCPHCNRELTLELEDRSNRCSRALLTVMEGPFWVGEQFLLPVGEDLLIGRSSGNWLSIDSDALSDVHCRLQLSREGSLIVEDRNSATGTWIDAKRIASGRLRHSGSFRAGDFRFRLDLRVADGTTITNALALSAGPAPMQVVGRVQKTPSRFRWLVTNRYKVARAMLLAFACLAGAYHLVGVPRVSHSDTPWLWASLSGAVVAGSMILCSRRLAMGQHVVSYLTLSALVVLAIVDLIWGLPVAAIAGLALAGGLTLLVMRVPSGSQAILGAIVGAGALLTLFIGCCAAASALAGSA